MLSTSLLLAASLVVAQVEETASPADHLKCYDGLIGKWVYKGPLQEDIPDFAEKNTQIVAHFCWKKAFDGNVIVFEWDASIQGKPVAGGKGLVGWDPNEKRIVSGGMMSRGGYALGVITSSEDGKTVTSEREGIDHNGRKISSRLVRTLKDENTLVYQAQDRKGGEPTGDSPKYVFTRCTCDEDEDDDEDDED
jgi:hypothetical protein